MSASIPDTFVAKRDEESVRVLDRLRHLVRTSTRTQRSIECENGFKRGYLSQVLKGHIALTIRHLIGVLRSLDVAPYNFFANLEDDGDPFSTPVLMEIRERMARYDAALDQLAQKGLLERPTKDHPEASDGTP